MSEEKAKEPLTIKGFFKSTSFKCIVVLLAIVLISGILLTICNSLFYVSDQERLDRAIAKIYGYSVTTEEVDLTNLETEYDNGTINSAYHVIDDGNYLINASGTGGFGGNVTCWIIVEMSDNAVSGIAKVVIDSGAGETYLSRITDEDLEFFTNNYGDGYFSSTDYASNTIGTGATAPYTRNAITNAVNTALEFTRTQITNETEASESPLAGFAYTQYINAESTTYEVNGTEVSYSITTNGPTWGAFEISVTVDEGIVTKFEIVTNGSSYVDGVDYGEPMPDNILDGSLFIGKNAEQLRALINAEGDEFVYDDLDNTLHTGATQSNFACTYAALFAAANYDLVLSLEGGVQ